MPVLFRVFRSPGLQRLNHHVDARKTDRKIIIVKSPNFEVLFYIFLKCTFFLHVRGVASNIFAMSSRVTNDILREN